MHVRVCAYVPVCTHKSPHGHGTANMANSPRGITRETFNSSEAFTVLRIQPEGTHSNMPPGLHPTSLVPVIWLLSAGLSSSIFLHLIFIGSLTFVSFVEVQFDSFLF